MLATRQPPRTRPPARKLPPPAPPDGFGRPAVAPRLDQLRAGGAGARVAQQLAQVSAVRIEGPAAGFSAGMGDEPGVKAGVPLLAAVAAVL